jgi:adenosine deaminase/adenosine deaminase CECR1
MWNTDRRIAGCSAAPRGPAACQVTRRYLQQSVHRRAQRRVRAAHYAFELAQAERRVVGINLVAPEDARVALRDYRLHMQMIGWLGTQYPGVSVALHAGELTLGLVPPSDLRFHIREAVEVGKARRIGHGVSVSYERERPNSSRRCASATCWSRSA